MEAKGKTFTASDGQKFNFSEGEFPAVIIHSTSYSVGPIPSAS